MMLVLCTCWSSYTLLHTWQYLVFLQVVDSTNERHRLWSRDIQAFEELERLICTAEKEEKYTCIRMCGILLRGISNTVVTLSCEWRQRQWLLVCIQGGKHKWAGLEGFLQLLQNRWGDHRDQFTHHDDQLCNKQKGGPIGSERSSCQSKEPCTTWITLKIPPLPPLLGPKGLGLRLKFLP